MSRKLSCIIIDDDLFSIRVLEELCNESEHFSIDKTFTSAIDALKYLKSTPKIDLLFLDIHMPDISGLDLAEMLPDGIAVVFTTADDSFAIKAFDYVNVIDYMVKPVGKERFSRMFQKISMRFWDMSNSEKETGKSIFFNVNKRLVQVYPNQIYYIEAKGDYVLVVTEKERLLIHATIKKMREYLNEEDFFQTHRSYIVNVSKIQDIEDNSILLLKKVIPISRNMRKSFFNRINMI